MAGPSISSDFDAGNIRLVETLGQAVRLHVVPDPRTEVEQKSHMQWFAFRSTLDPKEDEETLVTYVIDNAGECSYAEAWEGSEVCVSHDQQSWRRVANTEYDEARGALSWEWRHSAAQPTAYFAYFDLYPRERQRKLVARCAAATGAPGLRVGSLGQSLDGRELDVVTVGTGPLQAWVIHRQHPGESQASFFAEGLLTRLLGLDGAGGGVDPLTAQLLEGFTFHVVPCMNPDGAARGHLRTNAAGANLNREWAASKAGCYGNGAPREDYAAPTLRRSPEVHHTLAAMDAAGCDLFVDVHGDEALPFGFLAGSQGVANWGPRLEALHGAFVGAYVRANADMQAAFGYEPDPPRGANYAVAGDQVASRFDCLAVTLEMPFKDNAANPGARRGDRGFDGARCAALGASLLDAVAHVQSSLRGVPEPRFERPDDAYVAPVEDKAEVDKFLAAMRGRRAGQT